MKGREREDYFRHDNKTFVRRYDQDNPTPTWYHVVIKMDSERPVELNVEEDFGWMYANALESAWVLAAQKERALNDK